MDNENGVYMKADVYDLSGNVQKEIEMPKVFSVPIREDLIRRAVQAMQANRRQVYGTNILAGKRTSAHYHGVKDTRGSMKNREVARAPRLHGDTVPHLFWKARFVPQAVGGREAHPPKVEKIWKQKINKKEKRLALASAIAAAKTMVIADDIEKISKTKDLKKVLLSLKLGKELEKKKKIRAGRGKMRGRKYRKKKSLLIVVAEDKGIKKAGENLPGIDIARVDELNAELLAPGAAPGRKVLWSEKAIKKLEEKL